MTKEHRHLARAHRHWLRPGKTLSSPVGIVDASSQAVRTDYRDYLKILALISLSLALLNLLPLLPLDGGHILFSLDRGDPGPLGRAAPSTSGSRSSELPWCY